jgi:carbon storage regulator
MLVLSRRPGEAIRIGDNIIVYVTQTKGDRVTLGIDAPRSISIMRGELQETLSAPVMGTSGDSTSTQWICDEPSPIAD